MKEAVFNDCGYRRLSDDSDFSLEKMKSFDRTDLSLRHLYDDKIYKILEADTPYDCGLTKTKTYRNGSTRKVKDRATLKQRIIVTFSRKSMEYQRWARNRQIERARKLLEGLDPETYKKGPHDVTRFIRRDRKNDNGKTFYYLDEEKIKEEKKYDGFYAIATNLEDDAKDVLEVLEECFKILKTNLSSRPVFVWTEDHIKDHFMMCYNIASYLSHPGKETAGLRKKKSPEEHYTVNQIIDTLNSLTVVSNKNADIIHDIGIFAKTSVKEESR